VAPVLKELEWPPKHGRIGNNKLSIFEIVAVISVGIGFLMFILQFYVYGNSEKRKRGREEMEESLLVDYGQRSMIPVEYQGTQYWTERVNFPTVSND
jgi:hypothetical protein